MVGATVRILLLACAASPVVVALRAGNATTAVRAITAVQDDATLTAEVDEILSKIESAAKEGSSSYLRKPEPEPSTVPYSPVTCRNLFAYKDNRDVCLRLQKVLCGRNCTRILDLENATEECQQGQEKLCFVPTQNLSSSPVKVEAGSNATLTFCNAYISMASSMSLQHDKYYAVPDPKPFVSNLKYTECQQASIPVGEKVNIYIGNHSMASYAVGSDNAVVMIGQYNIGESEVGIHSFTFEDEGYKRPILCSAYPSTELEVKVGGRTWHPFADAKHPTSIGYLECEKLALDHADSLVHHEILDFYTSDKHTGEVEISPMKSLYVIGSTEKEEVMSKDFALSALTSLKGQKAKK